MTCAIQVQRSTGIAQIMFRSRTGLNFFLALFLELTVTNRVRYDQRCDYLSFAESVPVLFGSKNKFLALRIFLNTFFN